MLEKFSTRQKPFEKMVSAEQEMLEDFSLPVPSGAAMKYEPGWADSFSFPLEENAPQQSTSSASEPLIRAADECELPEEPQTVEIEEILCDDVSVAGSLWSLASPPCLSYPCFFSFYAQAVVHRTQ